MKYDWSEMRCAVNVKYIPNFRLNMNKKVCKNISNIVCSCVQPIVHSFIQEVGTVLPIKNRVMMKMSSVLDLMELKVDVIKIFLPLLVSFLNEYSDIIKANTL